MNIIRMNAIVGSHFSRITNPLCINPPKEVILFSFFSLERAITPLGAARTSFLTGKKGQQNKGIEYEYGQKQDGTYGISMKKVDQGDDDWNDPYGNDDRHVYPETDGEISSLPLLSKHSGQPAESRRAVPGAVGVAVTTE